MKRNSFIAWVLGYYTIEIPRSYCEDFLNLCMRYGFTYYDLKIDEEKRRVTVVIPASERRKLFTACKVWQIRVKIKSRTGLAESLSRYRGRWGLLIGGALSIALFLASQSVIWRIDVTGNERLDRQKIIEILAQNGMSVGDPISKINTDFVEQKVMINNGDVAWLSINLSGTVASVEIKEVIDTKIKEKETKPANLVAKYDAQIVSLEVYSGFLCVSEGEYVRAGQLLISGIYQSEKAPIRYARANGNVMARVSQTFEVEIPLLQNVKVPTGDKKEQKTLIFFGKSIKLFANSGNLGSSCDIMNYEYVLNPFSFGELPVSLKVDAYYPYTVESREIDEREAMEKAYEELRKRIDEELPNATILKKSLYGEIVDGKYILKCDLVAICNIAQLVEFEILGN